MSRPIGIEYQESRRETAIGYRSPSDAWITEGGAEMMAFTLLAASDHDYVMGELQRAVDDCIKLGVRPIAGASDRHESRAFYACGTVFALAASGAARRGGGTGFFDFIEPLLTRHRSDHMLDGAEWLGHLDTLLGATAPGDAIRSMIAHGSDSPARTVETILRARSESC